MFKWIGSLFVGNVIKGEIEKLKGDLAGLVRQAIEDAGAMKGLKHQLYLYADAVLQEGQGMSKEKLDAWWIEKRAELKTWAGE